MNRIDLQFDKLKKENKKALITFITCGDPSLDETRSTTKSLQLHK